MAGFVHLHVHSEYSLLDGLNSCHELAERAVELGMPTLALTDHGAMYGAVQFYKACKAAGIKPIIGMEAYVAPRSRREKDPQDRKPYHLILLAQNESGYRNLMRLATVAQLEGFYYKPRIDKDILAECADGLIVLSGCGTSEVPRLILEGQLEEARRVIAWYRDVFPGRYFLEIQDHDIPELARANRQMIALAREFDLPLVATNDVHYTHREEAGIHDVLLCIQTGKTVTEPNRLRMDGDTYYMRDAGEMAALFRDVPEALTNTLRVAEMCDLKLEFGRYHLPIFHVPAEYDAQSYLRYLCEEGLQQRYAVITPEIRQRLEHELAVIHRMGFDTYFLIVWDLCRFAREHDIWWNVRGSAAGSIVAYTLGITNLEPLQHGLIFERFLNLGRVTMPDIDLDFPDDQRDQLIRYTIEKYGQEQVAQIITFGTMGAKAAIRDVGRALDYPLAEVDRIARLVPFGPKVTLDQALAEVPELREAYENEEHIRRLVDTARGVEGNVRHASTHAAGVVVSDAPLVTYTPLNRPTSGGEGEIGVVTQYTMEELEELGLLKIDFLGLATLTIMRRACELIRQRHGVRLNLHNIPTEDPAIFDLLSRGDVMGVFQVEGAGMRRVLMKMQPRQFDHIVATISLFRPGPMEYIDDYIDRMHGRKPIEYRHPRLEPILGETYGVCIAGDAIVTDVCTGRRLRLDECGSATNLVVQGVDADWRTVTARVTRWVANGQKPVYRVTLQNGASIKLTADHRVLTEDGWRPIRELSVGDYIATPPYLIPQNESFDRDKLRVLAYLIADGDLGNMASVKDPYLLAEYERCLRVFPNLKIHRITQAHEVVRVGVAKHGLGNGFVYHTPNVLLAWLRELGLKHPAGDKPGGCRSDEKFVPEFVFALSPDLIAWFLASLWDCDGYMGRKLCHYKTTSRRLAEDVQTLLLKLGIQSTIHTAGYASQTGHKSSYQVTVYDTARLAAMLQPLMVTDKRQVACIGRSSTTIARAPFIAEVEAHTTLSKRALMFQYGIDRQHFYSRGRQRPRISGRVITGLAEALGLQETQRRLRLNWERIIAIEPAGVEPVYDLTVENIHNFTANNILVHNCVYQEQIIRILTDIAGYSASDADLVRRCASEDTLVVDANTGRLIKIRDVQPGMSVLALDDQYRVRPVEVTQKFDNGSKPLYRVTTKSGRAIELTANHPLLTVHGWCPVSTLKVNDAIAVPWIVPAFGQRRPDPNEVKILAYLIGDGQCVQREGYPVARFYNLAHQAHLKRIPNAVFEYDADSLALFIGTLWNTDGSIERTAISYGSSSQHLIEQLAHLLRRFGINAWQGKKATTHRPHYRLVIRDQEEIQRFAATFGPYLHSAKRQKLDRLLVQANQRRRNRSKYQIPAAVPALVHEAKVASGLSWREAEIEMGIKRGGLSSGLNFRTFNRALSQHRLDTPGRAFDSQHLCNLAQAQVLWDPIVSIEPAGEKRVYDLAVPPYANFIANDIVIHNSIGKKKKEELLRHRASFVEGAVRHGGLLQEIAADIFDDIEYFARYGFNKAHGADYAVLTCQTAYLKARYPVEYMTALLSVERNNTEKVGLLIAECRRMNIEVLPPDVNCSDLDFTIEEQPDGRPAIRFGLAAVKNVGEGAVEAILAARRAGGPFRDLDDFCRRVDVRQVNRRALECLIKVGALQPFGTRAQLLSILDRIISLSANLHRAREMGQMSLFETTGAPLATGALLPASSKTPEVPQKESLAWEKDLVGAYISEHPLAEALVRLQDVVTAYVGALAEMNGQQVTVVGMVQRVRRHTTKKGDEMAFVTLEDLQGECDVVVFPRLWKQTRHLWQPERILVVGGKVDMGQRDEPSLLCDWAKTPEEVTVPAERDRPQAAMPTRPSPPQPPKVQPAPLPARTVYVTLARTGEQARDVQTLRRIHSLLAQRPGRDHFTIRLIGGTGKPVELAFPNDTTSYSPELAQELASIVGADAIQVVEGIR